MEFMSADEDEYEGEKISFSKVIGNVVLTLRKDNMGDLDPYESVEDQVNFTITQDGTTLNLGLPNLREVQRLKDAFEELEESIERIEELQEPPDKDDFDADIIESGVSSEQRDRLQSIKTIIDNFAEDGEAKIEEVIQKAEEEGFDKEDAEDVMDRLKRDGELYEPKEGYIQVI